MKVPPKRKGNAGDCAGLGATQSGLNESPSEKEGKSTSWLRLNPPLLASMKVPPKRKGNGSAVSDGRLVAVRLNESPSEKEGKSSVTSAKRRALRPQ